MGAITLWIGLLLVAMVFWAANSDNSVIRINPLYLGALIVFIVLVYAPNLPKLRLKLMRPLNTPGKRIGGFFLLLGLVILSSDVQIITTHGHNFLTIWWSAMTHNGSAYEDYPSVVWSTYLSIIGLLLSYLYEKELGRLVRWAHSD